MKFINLSLQQKYPNTNALNLKFYSARYTWVERIYYIYICMYKVHLRIISDCSTCTTHCPETTTGPLTTQAYESGSECIHVYMYKCLLL